MILIASGIDIIATYNYVNTFHKMYPKLDYKQLEANLLVRYFWKKFGMRDGSIVAAFATLGILIVLLYNVSINLQWFILGALCMMNIYHILNISQLNNMKDANNKKNR